MKYFKKLLSLSILFYLVFSCKKAEELNANLIKSWDLKESWVISAAQAISLIENKAILLDARDEKLRLSSPRKNAVVIDWLSLSQTEPNLKGRLKSSKEILDSIEKIGINLNTVVIVLGDPLSGWGEEGRIVWSLRSLGHKHSYFVDGGVQALEAFEKIATKENTKINLEVKSDSNTVFQPTEKFSTDVDKVKESLKQEKGYSFIDAREEREFKGETPYGEQRGGHLPNAKWIYYKSFLTTDGFIKTKEDVLSLLSSKGISPNDRITSYCTGGVRSAWLTSVLVSYGLEANNYAGSMWEWSSLNKKDYPLVLEK
jgi:thiosulfate/3-mercaptopyruvate sulfurtransferase